MNKLISRNPVLRFKLGRKVLFAKEGTYRGIRVLLVATSNGKEMYGYNDPKSGKRTLIYGNLLDVKTGKGNANGYIYKGSDGKWYQNGKIMTKFSSPTSPNSGTAILESTIKPYVTQRSNSFNKYGMAGDIQRNWNGLVGTIDDESIKMLSDLGLDTSNARAALDSLNTLLANNNYGFNGLVAADNKWGNQSRGALKFIWDNWKAQLDRQPKTVEEPPLYQNPGIRAAIEAEIPTTPEIETEKAIVNNTPNLTNFPMNYRIKADRSITRDIINELGGNAYDYTGYLRKALRHYLNGEQLDDKMKSALLAFGDISRFDRYKNIMNTINKPFMKLGGILPSRNIVERFKNGRKIVFAAGGTPIKRFVLANTEGFKKEFDTRELAEAYRKANKIVGKITDLKNASDGSVVKVSRVAGKDAKTTAYDRQEAEKGYNSLSYKDAYKKAQASGNKYFAYKGKAYKTDLANGKDNMTDMIKLYGNNLGWDKDPKLNTKKSIAARALYRKDVNTSEVGHTKEVKKYKPAYVSSNDGGELFSNFMGLASPTRWAGAVGRASRGEGNTGTFVGKVLNNMLDPQNGARENQGIFSSGLVPADEQWAAEHPVISGVVNGALDAVVFGPKPKFSRDFKFKTNWGYNGRQFNTVKEEVPMGIFEGDLNISPGVSTGSNPYIQLGKQVGETTKTVTRRVMTNPGTKYVKSVTEKPTGKYNFSWSEGMKDMFPWITANTFNRTMQQ